MTNREQVDAYIDGILSGEIVAGRLVRLAVRRHVADLESGESRGLYFDERIADEACSFFPLVLRHTNSPWTGEPFTLTPSQLFVTWCLYGWRRQATGLRRFRKAYVSAARKWGKTQYCAGLALMGLVADNPLEVGAEIYVAATKEDQANKMHSEAIRMAEKSPSIKRIATITKKNIAIPKYHSFFRPLGSDSKTNAGWSPHEIFLDELCDWQEHHRGLYGALTTGSGARTQPLRFVICTAGDDDSKLWQEEDDFAVKVLESVVTGQIIDDHYFAFVARIDDARTCDSCDGKGCDKCDAGVLPADDPLDESCWIKAQPNLGTTVQLETYREDANEARHRPTAMNDFIRYQCNRVCSSNERAISMDLWRLGGGPLGDWEPIDTYGAFDLGRKSDLASLGICRKIEDDEDDEGNPVYHYEIKQWSFTHEEVPLPLNQEPWSTFIRTGALSVNSGNCIDLPGAFKDRLLQVTEEYRVIQWAFDPHNAGYLALELQRDFGEEFCYEFRQTHGMYNESLDEFLKCVKAGRIKHGDDPLLTFAASNLVINRNNRDEWMPKKDSSTGKIDPIVVAIMAFGGSQANAASGSLFWNPKVGV